MVGCDDDQKADVDALRKKVIKRLIDISSPTNEYKKILFQQFVVNKENTRVIIELSVEMGLSVDGTKMMLMNNCL